MSEQGSNRYHSVQLSEADCKGCTICVTSCPVEAIRVRDGKARILEERCIDCGECIRRCPNHAKQATVDQLSILGPQGPWGKKVKVALPAPSLYGQFEGRWSVRAIHRALVDIGFDAVFPVASATGPIVRATRRLLSQQDRTRPLISSSCPTIIKYIQIRFPSLLGQVEPLIAPMELAARLAKRRRGDDTAAFFLSPCSGKITEARWPLGNEQSSVDGVFSLKDLYLPVLNALKHRAENGETALIDAPGIPEPACEELAWGRARGEAAATAGTMPLRYLAVDGIDAVTRILSAVEDGQLTDIDFLELMACREGCVGGPLTVRDPVLARDSLERREIRTREASGKDIQKPVPDTKPSVPGTADNTPARCGEDECFRHHDYPARPALTLDPDYQTALKMMDDMERIYTDLPQLDCGCCGAPNCHALAEDIVRGRAQLTDCVIILKERYQELLP